ncbi:MAG: S49 family peptidase [Anaerolineales bacterium]|nr:S49 family peptidase [Anaerolineales bacterium]MCX7753972.1 S49 family peptidase [Anaerolineales bacterium]MDW8276824.1 S49 family peptidase [Anaerolineales bacterium]
MEENTPKTRRTLIGSILLWVIVPLVLGSLTALLISRPVIGIITLRDSIYAYTAENLIKQIEYARENENIAAVVLVLESPGGTVVHTEAIYLELLALRKEKPLVVSIDGMAASGAYYLTAAADYAFAKPTSMVGNIGVIGMLPDAPIIFENIISTGPYKLWGSPRDTYMRQIETIKQAFYEVVRGGRGERLKAKTDVVLSGQIWPATTAYQLGLIDELGSQTQAVEKAAEMAGVRNYKTQDLSIFASSSTNAPYGFFAQSENGTLLPYPKEAGIYLLYIPPMQAGQK